MSFRQTAAAYESLGDDVVHRNYVQRSKCLPPVQRAGEVAGWIHGLEACWGFKAALRWLASEAK